MPRFSLMALLAMVAVVALTTQLLLTHRIFGLVLALPHVVLSVVVMVLVRQQRLKLAVLVGVVYCTLWGATGFFAANRVQQLLEAEILAIRHSYVGDPGEPKRLDHDPFLAEFYDDGPGTRPPWYFIDHATVPCPGVVAVYASWRYGGTSGGGGMHYFLWLGSEPQRIRYSWRWMS